MSKLNDVLVEAKEKLESLDTAPTILNHKTVIVYDADDLLNSLKVIRSYPAVGIVYEGMRSKPEEGATLKYGISAEIVLAFILIEQGDAIHATEQKKTRAIDYLDAMRGRFMGQRSTATGHAWQFLVESPAELKAGMVCWIQRWALPVQLPPRRS